MQTCDRCGCETRVTITSMFNTQTICEACKERERRHPAYEQAREAEHQAVVAGDLNFPGVGLPADLLVSAPAPART